MSPAQHIPTGPDTTPTDPAPTDPTPTDPTPTDPATTDLDLVAEERPAEPGRVASTDANRSSSTSDPAARSRSAAARQGWWVLLLATSITTLLVGIVAGSWWKSGRIATDLKDPEFLQRQLQAIAGRPDQDDGKVSPAQVRVARMERRKIRPRKPLFGRLLEYRRVTLSSEIEGKIAELPVEAGSQVIENQTVLAKVDATWSQLALKQSQAEAKSIQLKLDLQKKELQRFRELAEVSSVTTSELEGQVSLVGQLEADLQRIQSLVAERSERLARTTVIAPFDGTVIRKHAEIGQTVAAGTPIVEIVSRGVIDVDIRVPETFIDWITIGSEMPVSVEPLHLERVAKVVAIVPYGLTSSRTFPVRLRMDDDSGRLKAGMSVRVMVPQGLEREEMVVDQSAVLERPDGTTVWLAVRSGNADYRARSVAVRVLARDGDRYAVTPESDSDKRMFEQNRWVIVEGAERLVSDQQVRIVTVDPQLLDNLPQASGHELLN